MAMDGVSASIESRREIDLYQNGTKFLVLEDCSMVNKPAVTVRLISHRSGGLIQRFHVAPVTPPSPRF